MARYIEAERDSFPTLHQKELNDYMKGWNACLKSVLQQPTADVVEIPCRCNECKSFVENKEALVTYCTRECKNITVKPSDFCSYGKRK